LGQQFTALYADYRQGLIERRGFLARLAALAGSSAAAAAILPMIQTDAASAATQPIVLPTDPRIKIEPALAIPGPANFKGYLVTPTNINIPVPPKTRPAVVVVGESRGMNTNLQVIARRLGTEGYIALAVDYLSAAGGPPPSDEEAANAMTAKLKPEDVISWYKAASQYLKSRPDVSKIGVMGFGWGGGVANELVIQDPLIDAAVIYYGHNPDLKQVGRIRAPLLGHYAGLDGNILQSIPAYDAALTAAKKTHSFYIYPGANTGFLNDSNAARWDPVNAQLSWDRSVAFLHKYLGA
jgi:carboxymethylenebutenolidase